MHLPAKALLVLEAAALIGCSGEPAGPVLRKPLVKVATVAMGTLHAREQLWGEVATPPGGSALLGSIEGGYLAFYRVAEGDRVHRGDPLVEIASEPTRGQLAEGRARLAEAEAKAGAARAREERTAELLKQGAASTREEETAQAEARMDDAAAAGARASVEAALRRLARTQIRSPIDGQVLRLLGSPGEALPPGSRPLIEVADTGTLEVRAVASASQARRIQPDQIAEIEFLDPQTKGHGVVLAVSPRVDAGGAVAVRIALAVRPPDLRIGQFATAEIDVGGSDGLLIPESSLQEVVGAPVPYVLVVDGSKVHRRSVAIGRREGGLVEVRSGLQVGDRIVVSGGHGLPDGAEVDLEK